MQEKKLLIGADSAGKRVDVFLKDMEPELSRTQVKEFILQGRVIVGENKVKPHYRLREGDLLKWQVPEQEDSSLDGEDIPLNIVFEDDDIIVLDKPSGLVVHPGAGNKEHTLANALLFHTSKLSSLSKDRPGIVHRLDKDTSGIMVIAKNNHSHLELSKQFKKHSIERRYIALVSGHIEFDEGVIDIPIKRHVMDRKKMSVSFSEEARPAQTRYHVLKRYPEYTAVELFPETGRTHQLRVHLNYLGHPVLGDSVYGRKTNFPRLALHAKDLGFNHPSSGEFMKFGSPLPDEMKSAMPGVKI